MERNRKSHGKRISNRSVTAIVALLILGMTAIASADGDEERKRRPRGGPVLRALDADGNGTLSAAEIDNAAAALRTLDQNGDGELSASELRPERPERSEDSGRKGRGRR